MRIERVTSSTARGSTPHTRLVLFAHGSADRRWRVPFEELTANLAEHPGADKVRLAYMEFAHPYACRYSTGGGTRWRVPSPHSAALLGCGGSYGRRHSPTNNGRSDDSSARQD